MPFVPFGAYRAREYGKFPRLIILETLPDFSCPSCPAENQAIISSFNISKTCL
jgi:hypothetical protein